MTCPDVTLDIFLGPFLGSLRGPIINSYKYTSGVLDEDLVITYVKEGTSEERDTAKRWQLPETFYTNTKSCTGKSKCDEYNHMIMKCLLFKLVA